MDFEIAEAKCWECGKIKKLSFSKGKNTRHTFCITCNSPVIWVRCDKVCDEENNNADI